MRNLTMLIAAGVFLTGAVSCNDDSLEKKKAKLKELKAEAKELDTQIDSLTLEISAMDSTFGRNDANIVQVTVLDMQPDDFAHRIEVRGAVESRRNVMLSAETSGRIQDINVQEGARVKKGQVLVELDASVIRNNIGEVKTNMELAETVYKRQKNLWDQKIGTEIQYLEAKNRFESLKSRLNTLYSQLDMANVKAPFNGRIDEVPARLGEMVAPGMPLVRIISPGDMYIQADVSERYIGRFDEGDTVIVRFPALNKEITTTISSVSGVINRANRTFSVEVKLPKVDFTVKPNQVAVLNITDYTADDVLTIPTKLIQRDSEGVYVYRLNNKEGDKVAEKVHIETGTSYDGMTEVVSGLNSGDSIIDKGAREVTDGIQVKLVQSAGVTAGM
ncbi:efflux RND transporter periplasmic adaptor subunit [Roseivirga sp. BDSF3-8]|uniref:efflux RND transporter periplasmic adaptor subunit n=1 Tax=Roseivirga sp. BDSF3-8 TaxID=3241598 RepID=UPI003531E649